MFYFFFSGTKIRLFYETTKFQAVSGTEKCKIVGSQLKTTELFFLIRESVIPKSSSRAGRKYGCEKLRSSYARRRKSHILTTSTGSEIGRHVGGLR